MGDAHPRQAGADLDGALHLQGQHAQLDVRLDPPRCPMEHRPHLQPGLLHAPEAGLDDGAAFVGERHVLGGERFVVGDDHELAVELLRRLDLGCIELRPTVPIRAEVAAITARSHQRAGGLRMVFITFVKQRQFGGQFDQYLDTVRALLLRLGGIEAQHIALAPLAVADPDLLDREVVGHLAVAARAGEHRRLDIRDAAHRHRPHVAAEAAAEFDEIVSAAYIAASPTNRPRPSRQACRCCLMRATVATSAVLPGSTHERTGMPSRVIAMTMITCGWLSRPSLWPRWRSGANSLPPHSSGCSSGSSISK